MAVAQLQARLEQLLYGPVERPAPLAKRSAPSRGSASADGPNNFDGTQIGIGNRAPSRREPEIRHTRRPESLPTVHIPVLAERHIRSPARSPPRAATEAGRLPSSRFHP